MRFTNALWTIITAIFLVALAAIDDEQLDVVLMDKDAFDLQLDPSLSYISVTKEYPMGLNFSEVKRIKQAGFNGDIYVGILANSPRMETALSYLKYLFYGESGEK